LKSSTREGPFQEAGQNVKEKMTKKMKMSKKKVIQTGNKHQRKKEELAPT